MTTKRINKKPKARSRFDQPLTKYQFLTPHDKKKPEDFLDNPETGLRPQEAKKPFGIVSQDLRYGDMKFKVLPAEEIWESGQWLDQIDKEEQDLFTQIRDKDVFSCWVVTGEGTPGNYLYRCYLVPDTVAATMGPDHPLTWDTEKTASKTTTSWGKKDEHKLPFGMRYQCVGCGHWFKQDDLAGHVMNTCPGVHEGSNWAIMCECGSTCTSLDAVSVCKPGFPRKKQETEAPEEKPEMLTDLETPAEKVTA